MIIFKHFLDFIYSIYIFTVAGNYLMTADTEIQIIEDLQSLKHK